MSSRLFYCLYILHSVSILKFWNLYSPLTLLPMLNFITLSFFLKSNLQFQNIFLRKQSIKKIRLNTPFLKTKKYLFRTKFRFLSLHSFIIKKHPTINKFNNIFFNNLSHLLVMFSKIQFSLDLTEHPLVGTKIRRVFSEIKQKKTWSIFLKSFFAKRPRRWYKWDKSIKRKACFIQSNSAPFHILPSLIEILKLKQDKSNSKISLVLKHSTKPFYLNYLFHFFKLKVRYKKLKYIARHFKALYPKHLTKYKFKTPYFFLHLPRAIILDTTSLLSIVSAKFKTYRKVTRTFKRLNFKKKKKSYFYVNKMSKLFNISRLLPRRYSRKLFRRFSRKIIRFLRSPFIISTRSKKLKFKKFMQIQIPHYDLPSRFYIRKIIPYINSRAQIFSKHCLRSIFIKNIFISKLKKSLSWRQLKRRVYTKNFFLKRIKKNHSIFFFLTPFNYLSSQIYKQFALYQKNIKIFKVNFSNTSIKSPNLLASYLVNFLYNVFMSKSNFFSTYNIILEKTHQLYIIAKPDHTFFLPVCGFLYLSEIIPPHFFHSHTFNLHKLRRLKYNFAFRDDLSKHIFKKYAFNKTALESFVEFRLKQDLTYHLHSSFMEATSINTEETWANDFFLNAPLFKTLYTSYFDSSSFALETFSFQFEDHSYNPVYSIFTIRFKPGYMRYWRRARKDLQLRTKTTFRYQHQLTRYLSFFKRTANLQSAAIDELRLQNVLMKSRLVLDLIVAATFIKSHLIFVNGLCCSNIKLQLYAGDFIQLIISFKYYICFRWLLNHNLKLKLRIKNLSFKVKDKKDAQNPDKKYNNTMPLWITRYTNLFMDIVKYMEVDFFTLSIFLLYDPLTVTDINVYNETLLKPQIFNMYNWKYIT